MGFAHAQRLFFQIVGYPFDGFRNHFSLHHKFSILKFDPVNFGDSRRIIGRNPVIEEESNTLNGNISNYKATGSIFSGRNICATGVLSIPDGGKRVSSNTKIVDFRLAV